MIKKHLSGAQKQRHKAEVEEQKAKLHCISSYFINNSIKTASDDTNATSCSSSDDECVIDTSTVAGPAYVEHGSEDQAVSSDEILSSNKEPSDNLLLQNTLVRLPSSDAALWTVDAFTQQYCIDVGLDFCQNRNGKYVMSSRQHKGRTRKLCDTAFNQVSPSGEIIERPWLIYSPSTDCLFCFMCKLFSPNSTSARTKRGFDSWDHIGRLGDHERSTEHRQALTTYTMHLSKTQALEKHTADGNIKERNYWTEVLKRVVATIKFLATQGVALSGNNETFGSLNNGNFLGCLELIAEYDPFLACHINNYGNTGHGTTSHLSSTICEEFIKVMADKVKQVIVDELKLSKYFSFSIDSTLDTSHIDQLTLTVFYVLNNCTPVECFLNFVPVTSHTGLHLFNVINETLNDKLNINLKDCRGQTYNNASNMSDTYSGVQAQVIAVNEKAVYIPCMTHSLNLCSVVAAESCTDAITFFCFVQNLYVFFSGSTYRWGLLRDSLNKETCEASKRELFPKHLSDKRWPVQADALCSLSCNYKSVLQALGVDTLRNGYIRAEANSLAGTMDWLETAFMTTFWSSILTRVNKTSQLLQSETMDLGTAVTLLKSPSELVAAQQNSFEDYHESAMSLLSTASFQLKQQHHPKRMADDSEEPAVMLTGEEFKVKSFYAIMDLLVSHLNRRIHAYSEIHNCYCFLTGDLDSTAVKECLRSLTEFCSGDLNKEIFDEWVQWCSLVKQLASKPLSQALPTPLQMLTIMNMHNL
ncbi:zinc finger MYM-type protein 1-like [Dermochelys coriacea]|uniref:zinc finger MYM-type protein 1-like n=1 Tax=Dermochelys coriacea TaxID=27794 RepID=UPI001CA84017|nr:zinc finger MYM-type protein 1-like [Dermochelys coriacea]